MTGVIRPGQATAFAALRITPVTTPGCDIIGTWDASTSMISAPARLAMDSTTSAPAALSLVATTAHDGSFFQAGRAGLLAECGYRDGPLRPGHHGRLLLGQVSGECLVEQGHVDRQFAHHIGAGSGRVVRLPQRRGENAVPGAALDLLQALALIRRERGDVDQSDDIVLPSSRRW